MSQDHARAFLNQISDESVLQGAKAAEDPFAYFVKAGADAGFTFTREELVMAAGSAAGELSEEQLEGVAGGMPATNPVGRLATYIQLLTDDGSGQTDVPGIAPVG